MSTIPLKWIDPNNQSYLRAILYGDYGTWKTVTAASCSQKSGLLIAADDGWESLKNHPDILARTAITPYEGLSQLRQIAGMELHHDLVVLDTLTQVQESYIDFLSDNVTWGGSYRERTIPNPGSKVRPEEIPGLPDYHLARNKLRVPLRALMRIPCDVIFLAHLREPSFLEQQKGKLIRRPSVTQKLFDFVAREAHLIGFMEKRSGKPATISFKTDPKTVAKSRIGFLDGQVVEATEFPELLKKWRNN